MLLLMSTNKCEFTFEQHNVSLFEHSSLNHQKLHLHHKLLESDWLS